MLEYLKSFYADLEEKEKQVLSQDVEAIVAERVAGLTEKVREQVVKEVKQSAAVLAIKREAISDVIKLVEEHEKAEEVTETNTVVETTETI